MINNKHFLIYCLASIFIASAFSLSAEVRNLHEIPYSVEYEVEYRIPDMPPITSNSLNVDPEKITGSIYSIPSGTWNFTHIPNAFSRLDCEKSDVTESGVLIGTNRYSYITNYIDKETLRYNYTENNEGVLIPRLNRAYKHPRWERAMWDSGGELSFPFFASGAMTDNVLIEVFDYNPSIDSGLQNIYISPDTEATLSYLEDGLLDFYEKKSGDESFSFSVVYDVQSGIIIDECYLPVTTLVIGEINDSITFEATATVKNVTTDEEKIFSALFHEEPDEITINNIETREREVREGKKVKEYISKINSLQKK